MMACAWDILGVGVARSASGVRYYTQVSGLSTSFLHIL
jgi:uncharacterized protein YkwD